MELRYQMSVSDNHHIRTSGDLLDSARQPYTMYATRLMTEIFHLVQPSRQHTLCGLRISRVPSQRKANTLQLVNELPGNPTICKHCERINGQDVRN
jgi:hypothetical protein